MTNDDTVRSYLAAMRRGPAAEDEMMELFTDDAVYVEPFTGVEAPAVGKAEVRDRLRAGWETPLPDLELDVLSIESQGSTAMSRWECRSTALPGPVRGTDSYTFVGGRISRLEVTIDEVPPGTATGDLRD